MKTGLLPIFIAIAVVLSVFAYSEVFGASFTSVNADLLQDEYYQKLNKIKPDSVSKYVDAYGVNFYAVDCSTDCYLLWEK